MLPEQKLDVLLARHAAIQAELAAQAARDDFVRLSREFSELEPVVEAVKAYRAVRDELTGLDALLADPATDAEMRQMVELERPDVEARREALAQQIRLALLPKDA